MTEEQTYSPKAEAALEHLSEMDLLPGEEQEIALALIAGLLAMHDEVIGELEETEEPADPIAPWVRDATRLTVALENLAAVELGGEEEGDQEPGSN